MAPQAEERFDQTSEETSGAGIMAAGFLPKAPQDSRGP